jgi:hypothetical protein
VLRFAGGDRIAFGMAQWREPTRHGVSLGRSKEEIEMTLDRLVCANCAGPVAEGRCPTCRASRQRMQEQQGLFGSLSPAALIALLVALVACALIARHAFA